VRQTFTDDVRANARYLLEALRTIDVADGGFSLRTPDGIYHGASQQAAAPIARMRAKTTEETVKADTIEFAASTAGREVRSQGP
jgi:hypothetical protein